MEVNKHLHKVTELDPCMGAQYRLISPSTRTVLYCTVSTNPGFGTVEPAACVAQSLAEIVDLKSCTQDWSFSIFRS